MTERECRVNQNEFSEEFNVISAGLVFLVVLLVIVLVLGAGRRLLFGGLIGSFHGDLGLIRQAIRAGDDNLGARGDALDDLYAVAIADAHFYGRLMRAVVGPDEHYGSGSVLPREDRCCRYCDGIVDGL